METIETGRQYIGNMEGLEKHVLACNNFKRYINLALASKNGVRSISPYNQFIEIDIHGDVWYNTSDKVLSIIDNKGYNTFRILRTGRRKVRDELLNAMQTQADIEAYEQIVHTMMKKILTTHEAHLEGEQQSAIKKGKRHSTNYQQFSDETDPPQKATAFEHMRKIVYNQLGPLRMKFREYDNAKKRLILNDQGCEFMYTQLSKLIAEYEAFNYNSDLTMIFGEPSVFRSQLESGFDKQFMDEAYFLEILYLLNVSHEYIQDTKVRNEIRAARSRFIHRLTAKIVRHQELNVELIDTVYENIQPYLGTDESRRKGEWSSDTKLLRNVYNPSRSNDQIGILYASEEGGYEAAKKGFENFFTGIAIHNEVAYREAPLLLKITSIEIDNKGEITKEQEQTLLEEIQEMTNKLDILSSDATLSIKQKVSKKTQPSTNPIDYIASFKKGSNGNYKDVKLRIQYEVYNKKTGVIMANAKKTGGMEVQARKPDHKLYKDVSQHWVSQREREGGYAIRENASQFGEFMAHRLLQILTRYASDLQRTGKINNPTYKNLQYFTCGEKLIDLSKFGISQIATNHQLQEDFQLLFEHLIRHMIQNKKLYGFVYKKDLEKRGEALPSSYDEIMNIDENILQKHLKITFDGVGIDIDSPLMFISSNYLAALNGPAVPLETFVLVPRIKNDTPDKNSRSMISTHLIHQKVIVEKNKA